MKKKEKKWVESIQINVDVFQRTTASFKWKHPWRHISPIPFSFISDDANKSRKSHLPPKTPVADYYAH